MSIAGRCLILFLSTALSFAAFGAHADSWSRFRGPNGTGVSETAAPTPITWSESDHLQWKVELPGPGSSCPIVVGDQVFVTCWSGYGMERGGDPGDQQQLRRHLLSIDRNTGDIQWDKVVEPYLPEDEYGGMFAEHGYASHTPVSDGERVYVYFGKTGALAFDLEGNQLWHNKEIGTESGASGWGSSSSPILYEDVLIVAATAECQGLVGLNKHTGEEIWRQEASGFDSTWGTPVLAKVDENRTDLVIAIPGEIWGFDPSTGKFLWHADALDAGSYCSSAIEHDGIVYAFETHRGGGSIAIRAGGNGDASGNVIWKKDAPNRIASPLYHDGRLYVFSRGQVACYDAANGEEVFRERLRGASGGGRGQDYASPVMADGKIYYTARNGNVFVIEAAREMNQLAVNKLGEEGEDFSATPAITDDGQILIRSNKRLYCVALGDDRPESIEQANFQAPEEPAEEAEQQDRGRGGFGGGRGGGGGFDPAAMFNRQDANGDGKLAGDELTGRWRDGLEQNDTNKDGALTLEEFRAGMRNFFGQGRGGGGRGGRGGGGGGYPGGGGGQQRRDRPDRPPVQSDDT